MHFCYAQPYEEGDTVPDVLLSKIYNSQRESMRLGEGRPKLIILDFWMTNCSGCLKGFPKMDALQKEFPKDVRIVMVNPESLDATTHFFATRKLFKPALPFVTSDTLLSSFFPHDGYPYHVWLDSNLVVRHLTSADNTASSTIKAFLSSVALNFGKKESGRATVPSLLNKDYEEKIVYASLISQCIIGNQESFSDSFNARTAGVYIKCQPVVELYRLAFEENEKYRYNRPGRMVVQLAKPYAYQRPSDQMLSTEWKAKYSYNYRLVLPKERSDDLYRAMRQDLNRLFGLYARIEKRERNCLVLYSTDGINHLVSAGGEPVYTFLRSSDHGWQTSAVREFRNVPYYYLPSYLGGWIEEEYKMPFEDITGFSGAIDISLDGKVIEDLDLNALNAALAKYHLAIEQRNVFIDVLVITDN